MTLSLKQGVLSVVQNVESDHGIRARTKRKFLYGDIAYIATDAGWMYLSAVLICSAVRCGGWSLQSHMHTSLAEDTMAMA